MCGRWSVIAGRFTSRSSPGAVPGPVRLDKAASFGAGLEGFTGLGSSAFVRLGGAGGGFAGGTGGVQAGGFMGLLQSEQEIRNQRTT
jgi:hypothetical protein